MHYTIKKLQLDNNSSLDPIDYRGHSGGAVGTELVAFMTAHLGKRKWPIGSTTKFGPHSYLLANDPSIEELQFWNLVQKKKWHIKIGCAGSIRVFDKNNHSRPIPKGILKQGKSPAPQILEKEISDFLKKFRESGQ